MTQRNTIADTGTDRTRPWHFAAVACWLAATAVAFWWHGPRDRSPPGSPATLAAFDPAQAVAPGRWLEAQATRASHRPRSLTLVHLRDPDCGCNEATDPQVDDLRRQYAPRGLQVTTVAVRARDRDAPRWLSATPAAALLDADGALLYLGPVGDAGFCSRRATPVTRALDSAIAGSPTPARPTLGTGCFCT